MSSYFSYNGKKPAWFLWKHSNCKQVFRRLLDDDDDDGGENSNNNNSKSHPYRWDYSFENVVQHVISKDG